MNPHPILAPILAVFVAAAASGCASSRWYDARYTPAPAEAEITSKDVAGSQVRALVSVIGIARPDEKAGRAKQVEMRLRLENLGTVDADVDTASFALVSADLQSFGTAVVAPNSALSSNGGPSAVAATNVPAGAHRVLDVSFPVPDGERDWSGLNLRFALSFGGTPSSGGVKVTAGTTFERVSYVPTSRPDPYGWYYGYPYHGYSHAYWPGFVYCW